MVQMKKVAHYILLNKNTPALSFACTRNEFGEPEFVEDSWLVNYRPIGYMNLFWNSGRPQNTAGTSRNCWNDMAAMIWKAF